MTTLGMAFLATLVSGALVWLVSRPLDRHTSPRQTVWVWRTARLSMLSPVLIVLVGEVAAMWRRQGVNTGTQTDLLVPVEVDFAVELLDPMQAMVGTMASSLPIDPFWIGVTVYGLGLCVYVARAAARRLRLQRFLAASIPASGEVEALAKPWLNRLGLVKTHFQMRTIDAATSPFVVGFNPVIVLPEGVLKRPEFDFVLGHELTHIKRGDECDRLLGEVLATIFWFNPFAWMIERRLAGARELACDADMLDALNPAQRRDYAKAIADVACLAPATAFLSELVSLRRRRVRAALSHQTGARRMGALAAAGFAAIVSAVPAGALALSAQTDDGPAGGVRTDGVLGAEPDSRMLSTPVGEAVQAIITANQIPDFEAAISIATDALDGSDLTAYETGLLLQMRATARFQNDDIAGTLADFEAAHATGGFNADETAVLLFQIGQLRLALGNLPEGIEALEAGLAGGYEQSLVTERLMAQAYAQVERFEDAEIFVDRYLEAKQSPTASDVNLFLFIHQQLGRQAEAVGPLERHIEAADEPEDREVLALAALYEELGRSTDAEQLLNRHGVNSSGSTDG